MAALGETIMCCDFTNGWCGHMKENKCYFCKKKATRTTYWGNIGNRYQVPSCDKCVESAAKSDRHWAGLVGGFAEYNRYYDNKGS